jgi:predicted outer membrane protein
MHKGTPDMSTQQTFAHLLTAPVALLLTLLVASAQEADQQINWPMSIAVQTEAGQQITAGAYGVAYIDAPRVATLLQLRGGYGKRHGDP